MNIRRPVPLRPIPAVGLCLLVGLLGMLGSGCSKRTSPEKTSNAQGKAVGTPAEQSTDSVPAKTTATPTKPAAVWGTELVSNGGAEAKVAGWSSNPNFGYSGYGGTAGEWDQGVTVLPNQGENYFRLTVPAEKETTEVIQKIDVASAAAAIDKGDVTFTLSGYFGGFRDSAGSALASLRFLDEAGQALGEAATTPQFGNALPAPKVGGTSMALNEKKGSVPKLTRRIEVQLVGKNMQFAQDKSETLGLADNVSLILKKP